MSQNFRISLAAPFLDVVQRLPSRRAISSSAWYPTSMTSRNRTTKMASSRQLHLGAFMRPASIHPGAWRYPGAWPDMNFNFAHLKHCIQALERAKFDAFFMADHMAVLNMPLDALKRSHTVTSFEPFTLLSAFSELTDHISLVAPDSPPFD